MNFTVGEAMQLLGLQGEAPLDLSALARGLTASFYPFARASLRVQAFAERLRAALTAAGTHILPYTDDAEGRRVLITAGEAETGALAIDHTRSLLHTTFFSIVDGPGEGLDAPDPQARLNAVVQALTWHSAQVIVFVEEGGWTLCCMNGSISRYRWEELEQSVAAALIPKLAAPVVPPRLGEFFYHPESFSLDDPEIAEAARDLSEGSRAWADHMLFHTRLDSLHFRSPRYRRLTSVYLDHRTGMSYGFLARQLPQLPAPARPFGEPGSSPIVHLTFLNQHWDIPIPDVKVLTTRSGCDKRNINPERDLVILGFQEGKLHFYTQKGSGAAESRPSYDTRTILGNAVANVLVGSLLRVLQPQAPFLGWLGEEGLAQVHWHGDLRTVPAGIIRHGEGNPPVSCSTAQSALFAVFGKLSAAEAQLQKGESFLGDLHVEPLHVVNLSGRSLLSLAQA